MPRRSLKREMIGVLIFAAFVPVAISAALLLAWAASMRTQHAVQHEIASQQLVFVVSNTLQRVESVVDVLRDSRELADYVNAQESLRNFTENVLIGRLADLSSKLPVRATWQIFDEQGHLLVAFPETSTGTATASEPADGFAIDPQRDHVVFRSGVRLDDQYLSGPASRLRAKIVLILPTSDLKKHIPQFDAVKAIPADLKPVGFLIDQDALETTGSEASVSFAIVSLLATLLTSLTIGITLLNRRILGPLKDLTDEVLQGTDQVSVEAGLDEVDSLRNAFKAYVAYSVTVREELMRQSRLAAVGRMMQLLAHDVRKPFTLLRMGLRMLSSAANKDETQRVVQTLVPEVDKALANVNGMIKDIMEVGSRSNLTRETHSLRKLLRRSITEVAQIRPTADVSFTYQLQHELMLDVDAAKLQRVFSNIIDNGFQAMALRGGMWFKSYDASVDGQPFVQFCIGNEQSFIEAEERESIFEVFFTHGKRGGTGLGLAIVQKLVSAHGGRVWCESDRERGTEFWMTLPAIRPAHATATDEPMPSHSAECTLLKDGKGSQKDGQSPDQDHEGTARLEAALVQALARLARPLRVLLIDDDGVYQKALEAELRSNSRLAEFLEISVASNALDAETFVELRTPDVVLCDVDLGPESPNGYELVKSLRTTGLKCQICIHSNRSTSSDYREALDAGADAFFPKPMPRLHFLKLCEAAVRQLEVERLGMAKVESMH